MDKSFFLKNRKMFWVFLGVVFVISLFFLKTKSAFKNEATQNTGLAYNSETVGDLVRKDTDLDGILDWEESLWGTDPTKIDTDGDGEPDGTEIVKLKGNTGSIDGGVEPIGEEELTETDKFSRELFSTVVALNQTGGMDQGTVDNLSASLLGQIENAPTDKIFSISEIKTIEDNSVKAVQTYSTTLDNVFKKSPIIFKDGYGEIYYQISENLSYTLQAYLDTEDVGVLSDFDPMIKEIEEIIGGMLKMNVPKDFAILHLVVINGFERVLENLKNSKLVDSDTILAVGAATKIEDNIDSLQRVVDRLQDTIYQKLK